MLVISRKIHERVRIAVQPSAVVQEIELCVTDIRGNLARLGFEADRQHVSIVRAEVLERREGRVPA